MVMAIGMEGLRERTWSSEPRGTRGVCSPEKRWREVPMVVRVWEERGRRGRWERLRQVAFREDIVAGVLEGCCRWKW